ncbi:MAG: SPOR domain-containing protein [Longimicrobiales bacterium]|nr:SPOR domain-containing protein [Longimicrobiales bacterium]
MSRHPALPGLVAVATLAAVMALAVLPATAGAQSLDTVDALLRDGRVAEAREALVAWSGAHPRPGRDDRQRELWLRGVLTLDPAQAAVIYRQLVLEYPGGPFTASALLRLGQSAAARGDLREAAAHFRVLERDHPGDPARLEAVAWLGRHGSAFDSSEAAGAPPASRPSTEPPLRASRAGERTAADAGAGAGAEFAAQAGAFTALEGARALAERLRAAGYPARVVTVQGSDFYRVRVGRFATPEEARALVARMRAAGFEAGVGSGVGRERPAGG